ncbi:MAG: MBL fold metallo-hydrolase [Rhodospirillaceae bacterium]|jgi:glyoxylase-like metal-dependent hydrolase (beta-lactamase superfamily II)|nr:MBL fold metallo-hydrolase [Rhodospirillaceae bacterium]MBT4219604.1 MBL fold metallo-hydrolase [Rhodospirillaceae bacterium]MBT4463341.1 MBL fold metallo-hydrolase [Rhodospirillaceae bacterium]MBT5013240.1 MBL fold metallo-hydrolase [Rhodospirillaceae bacterium]MBT5309616.1 MBL fold metallo-hydrolase [Rhodospirillaceae bacterium]
MFVFRFRRLMLAALLMIATALPVMAHDVQLAATDIRKMPLVKVAPSTYVIHGMQALPSDDNKGFINNPGFVVTDKGVIVIDPGSNTQVGDILLDHVKKTTDKPVVAVLNTHVHGDHWLGNHAVAKAYPGVPIYAHEKAIERLASGEDKDWMDLFKNVAPEAMKGTEIVIPDNGLKGGETLTLGGADFVILYPVEQAHTDTDIYIEIPSQKAIFLGDIVMNKRTLGNRVQEASFSGIEKATQLALDRPGIEYFIPGHGNSGGREVVENALKFISTLRASVKKYYDDGLADFEMRDKVLADLKEFKDWNGFDELGRAISFLYLEVEAEDFQ